MRSAHLGDDVLICLGCRRSVGRTRHLCQKATLDYARNFCPLHRLATLVLTSGEMIHGLQEIDVIERLALARLKREHKRRVLGVCHRHREPLEKGQRLVA